MAALTMVLREYSTQGCWGAMGRLAAGAYVTSRDEFASVSIQSGPPKTTADELGRTGGPGVAGKSAGVAPQENLTTYGGQDE